MTAKKTYRKAGSVGKLISIAASQTKVYALSEDGRSVYQFVGYGWMRLPTDVVEEAPTIKDED